MPKIEKIGFHSQFSVVIDNENSDITSFFTSLVLIDRVVIPDI